MRHCEKWLKVAKKPCAPEFHWVLNTGTLSSFSNKTSGCRIVRGACTCARGQVHWHWRTPCTQVQVPVTLYVIPFISWTYSLDLIPPSNLTSPSKFTPKPKLLWRIDIFRGSSFELDLARGYRATGRLLNWTDVQLADKTLILKKGCTNWCTTFEINSIFLHVFITSLFVHGCRVQMTSQQFFGKTFV